jgi:hypothetical protein
VVRRGATERRPWRGTYAARITAALLALHHDADLGYAPCHWCGQRATTADHYPVGRDEGGPDTMDNLVPACRPCNSRRGAIYTNRKRAAPAPPSRDW